MAIGERIHFFRTLRGMTQKYLGMAVGFPERSRRCSSGAVRNRHPDAEGRLDRCPGAYIRCIAPRR